MYFGSVSSFLYFAAGVHFLLCLRPLLFPISLSAAHLAIEKHRNIKNKSKKYKIIMIRPLARNQEKGEIVRYGKVISLRPCLSTTTNEKAPYIYDIYIYIYDIFIYIYIYIYIYVLIYIYTHIYFLLHCLLYCLLHCSLHCLLYCLLHCLLPIALLGAAWCFPNQKPNGTFRTT